MRAAPSQEELNLSNEIYNCPGNTNYAMTTHLWNLGYRKRTSLSPMCNNEDDDPRIKQWYFDCDDHYIDVVKDVSGKYSIFFLDHTSKIGPCTGWKDQADELTDEIRSAISAALIAGRNHIINRFSQLAANPKQYPEELTQIDRELIIIEKALKLITQEPI